MLNDYLDQLNETKQMSMKLSSKKSKLDKSATVEISEYQVKLLIGESAYKQIIKNGTKIAINQAKDWPNSKMDSKQCEFGYIEINFNVKKIMLFGGMWLKDGHQSSVVAEIRLNAGKAWVSEEGING